MVVTLCVWGGCLFVPGSGGDGGRGGSFRYGYCDRPRMVIQYDPTSAGSNKQEGVLTKGSETVMARWVWDGEIAGNGEAAGEDARYVGSRRDAMQATA